MSDEGFEFNWHELDDYDETKIDHFLKWLVPTVLTDSVIAERIGEVSDRYTNLVLTMQLNGVEVDARQFLEGCYGSMQRFAQDAAVAKLVEVIDFTNLVETADQLRSTLQVVARRIARDLGVARGLAQLGVDDDNI